MKLWTVAMLALTLAIPVFAADADADKPIRVRGLAKTVKADEGKTDQGSLVVTVKEEDMTFVITSETNIKNGDSQIKLTEVKVGDKLRVDYKEKDSKKVVVKLRVETNE